MESIFNSYFIFRQTNYMQNTHYIQHAYKLSPSPPIVGKTKVPDNYNIDISLHHLYPDRVNFKVPMDEQDHFNLQQAIHEVDAVRFLHLLEKYQTPVTLEHFIIMTIINLKDHLVDVANNLTTLLNNIGKCFNICLLF